MDQYLFECKLEEFSKIEGSRNQDYLYTFNLFSFFLDQAPPTLLDNKGAESKNFVAKAKKKGKVIIPVLSL